MLVDISQDKETSVDKSYGGKLMKNKKLLLVLGSIGLALVLTALPFMAGCARAPEAPPVAPPPVAPPPEALQVRAITSCSKFDYAWGTSNARAMDMLEEEFGAEITFLDVVPMVDQVKIFNDFAAAGSDFIIGWGYEFLDSANIVSADYPDMPFSVTCAPHPGSEGYTPNLASMYFTEEEGGYLAGILAANLTETKKIGFISGTDIPCVAKCLNAFRLGAYDTDPEVDVDWAYLGSWADVAKERELATALTDLGCDVLFALWIGLATADVCEEEGIHLIGSQFLSEYKPDIVVADHFEDMEVAVRKVFSDVLAGEFEAKPYQMTMQAGVSDLILNQELIPDVVSYELRDEIEEARQAILQGDLEIPRLVRVLPEEWPHETVPDYDEYLEPIFENIYGFEQYGEP